MYSIDDIVAYSSQGICRITEISTRSIGGRPMDYYILKPIYDERCTVSVPTSNPRLTGRMRAVVSHAEALSLMESISSAEDLWIDDDNRRREEYTRILTEGEPASLFALFKTLILRRRELEFLSRKLRTADEGFLRQAEKLICCECSYAGCGDPVEIRDELLRSLM